jgi:hypothetical protein
MIKESAALMTGAVCIKMQARLLEKHSVLGFKRVSFKEI